MKDERLIAIRVGFLWSLAQRSRGIMHERHLYSWLVPGGPKGPDLHHGQAVSAYGLLVYWFRVIQVFGKLQKKCTGLS